MIKREINELEFSKEQLRKSVRLLNSNLADIKKREICDRYTDYELVIIQSTAQQISSYANMARNYANRIRSYK